MQSSIEYLDKTESAMRKLFEGIDSYYAPLRRSQTLAFVSSTEDDEERQVELESWLSHNRSAITASFVDQREFVAESFAQATLCGAVLQIASKAIEIFSVNAIVTSGWESAIGENKNAVKFCYGRSVRGVPLGLVVYAARNQHTHFKDKKLHEPSNAVFNRLAARRSCDPEMAYRDPAFDLANDRLVSYASNIMNLIGWNTYESYEQDIRSMLGLTN